MILRRNTNAAEVGVPLSSFSLQFQVPSLGNKSTLRVLSPIRAHRILVSRPPLTIDSSVLSYCSINYGYHKFSTIFPTLECNEETVASRTLLLSFVRIGSAVKSLHMSSHAEGIIATKVAQIATKLKHAGVVNVSHVSLHVCLVSALVRAKRASELRISRVHLAAELHVPPQQILQREDLFAETTHVTFVIIQHRLSRDCSCRRRLRLRLRRRRCRCFRCRRNLKLIVLRGKLKAIDGGVTVHVTLHVPSP